MREEKIELIYGRWPVMEALKADRLLKAYLATGSHGDPFDDIVAELKARHVPFHWVERRKLDQMAGEHNQGVVGHITAVKLTSIDEVWPKVKAHPNRGPALLFLDGITDPHNLGSIIRSAYYFGVTAVVLPKWRAASLTGVVSKASAGAASLLPLIQVVNLGTAIDRAKDKGLWMVGADMAGEDVKKIDIPRPFGLVLGSEGEGLHQLIRKKCDLFVSISRSAQGPGIDSLNVGTACAVLLHQVS